MDPRLAAINGAENRANWGSPNLEIGCQTLALPIAIAGRFGSGRSANFLWFRRLLVLEATLFRFRACSHSGFPNASLYFSFALEPAAGWQTRLPLFLRSAHMSKMALAHANANGWFHRMKAFSPGAQELTDGLR